eukprot:CAMPEP_0194490298 /NCGR_PEP_ID=MMETSP0253-20130528/9561_1 /TAXON_ID=2966 /ORGANISM="Noctiluca scintillans" /LENGTH=498 /DNA_ID=CAMNT_0039330909 /DNA_START=30 /DNA_END=1527 /DNA_ORIENTATION=-
MQSQGSSECGEFPKYLKSVRQLGRGAYGTVHLCEDTRNGAEVAVKHVRHAAKHGKSMLREIHLLARLSHPNLLHLIDFPAVAGPDFEDVFLVLPYMPTDLHKVIQSQQPLATKHVQVILCQLLRAMAYLHASGVAHRDLKPANILLTGDCRLKVCDFGLARGDMPDDGEEEAGCLTEYVVTRWYRAPEVMLLPKQYTSAVDLWSVGCILCEILGRRALFPGKNHVDMVCRVARVLGSPPDEELNWLPKDSDAYRFLRNVCPPSSPVPLSSLYPHAGAACVDLAMQLLQWDPSKRISASDAQKHEYVRSFLPKEPPKMPDPFDWSFDGFKASSSAVRDKLYMECSRYHPEMLDRDLMPRSASGASIARATEVTPRHSFDTTPKSSVNTTPRTSLDRTPRTVSARSSLDVTPRTSDTTSRLPPAPPARMKRSSSSSGSSVQSSVQHTPPAEAEGYLGGAPWVCPRCAVLLARSRLEGPVHAKCQCPVTLREQVPVDASRE